MNSFVIAALGFCRFVMPHLLLMVMMLWLHATLVFVTSGAMELVQKSASGVRYEISLLKKAPPTHELYSQRAKLYRFDLGDWQKLGVGDGKLLHQEKTHKVRFMMRRPETKEIIANHHVVDKEHYCDLQLNKDSDRCWVWYAKDNSHEKDARFKVEQFALKLGDPKRADKFKQEFDSAKEINRPLFGPSSLDASKQVVPELDQAGDC